MHTSCYIIHDYRHCFAIAMHAFAYNYPHLRALNEPDHKPMHGIWELYLWYNCRIHVYTIWACGQTNYMQSSTFFGATISTMLFYEIKGLCLQLLTMTRRGNG